MSLFPCSQSTDVCVVCNNSAKMLIDLGKLPFTDTLLPPTYYFPKELRHGIPQWLLLCEMCGHGQLLRRVDPDLLYGYHYTSSSSLSSSTREASLVFIEFIKTIVGENPAFNCALDLGCNDLLILNLIKKFCKLRIGVDPIWKTRDKPIDIQDLTLVGSTIEELDLSELPTCPDLVICRHTLEHMCNPTKAIEKIIQIARNDALLFLELPCLVLIVENNRFDQVHNQHLHYFSVNSLLRMIDSLGGSTIAISYNPGFWSSMMIAVSFNRYINYGTHQCHPPAPREETIVRSFNQFQNYAKMIGSFLNLCDNDFIYGWGASQTLPILGYHMELDFNKFAGIIDICLEKSKYIYGNIPVRVIHPETLDDISNATVLVTSPDNSQSILQHLLLQRPKRIVYPLISF